jgi:hypothetical protein
MNNGARNGWVRRRELRRTRRLAEQRQRAWDEIRAQQVSPRREEVPENASAGATYSPLGHAFEAVDRNTAQATGVRPALFPAGPPPAQNGARATTLRSIAGILQPAVGVTLLTIAVVGGTPLVSGVWNLPWGIATGVAAIGLLATWPRTWRKAPTFVKLSSVLVTVVVTVSSVTGTLVQNVVEGRAQLRGSTIDMAVEEHHELERSLRILTENQGLLVLPPEQAIPLLERYLLAIRQAEDLAARWNPATAGEPPLPVIGEAYALLNRAAAEQKDALKLFVENLENPEPAKASELVERANVVAGLLGTTIPAALDDIENETRRRVHEEDR